MSSPAKPSGASKASSEEKHLRALRKLVARLPKTGSVLVVYSHAELSAMRRMVQLWAEPEVFAATRIIVAPDGLTQARATRGIDLLVIPSPFLAEQRAQAAAFRAIWREAGPYRLAMLKAVA